MSDTASDRQPAPPGGDRRLRLALYAALAFAVIGVGAGAASFFLGRSEAQVGVRSAIGGPFELVDQTGKPVSEADILGKPTMIFFGYTSCPNVCPTTLSDMTVWLKELGASAAKLNAVFVSVDPKRDTVKAMADYLSAFDPRIRGFTGTPEQIAHVIKTYRVFAKEVPGENGGPYLVDHTAAVYLMDAKDQFVGVIDYPETKANAVAKLKRLVGG
ncbi:MAG: SCO family protein [Bauldia sp.]